jgi:hypothetical protein
MGGSRPGVVWIRDRLAAATTWPAERLSPLFNALDVVFSIPGSEEGAPGALLLCYNREDGTLEQPVRVELEFSPGALATGHFNGDGRPDLASCDVNEPLVWILLHR